MEQSAGLPACLTGCLSSFFVGRYWAVFRFETPRFGCLDWTTANVMMRKPLARWRYRRENLDLQYSSSLYVDGWCYVSFTFFVVRSRDTINVGWDGRIFDCDFNQQLGLGMGTAGTNAGASEKLRAVHVCHSPGSAYRPWPRFEHVSYVMHVCHP